MGKKEAFIRPPLFVINSVSFSLIRSRWERKIFGGEDNM